MLMTGKCIKIMQLSGRNHADKIFLMSRQSNLIGFYFLRAQKKMSSRPEPQERLAVSKAVWVEIASVLAGSPFRLERMLMMLCTEVR